MNVRSVLSKFNAVKLNLLNGAFEIVGLSESWLHQNIDPALIQVRGYQLLRLDRNILGWRFPSVCKGQFEIRETKH